jgi:regulator of protease activity HflC (stomatin/prohibitin superfamily)
MPTGEGDVGAAQTRPAAQAPGTGAPASAHASAAGAASRVNESVAVSILRVAVTVQYRIRDAYQWVNHYSEPRAVLETLADREVMRRCASTDVKGLLGPMRAPIERELRESIQKSADDLELGVDIVFLGLQGVHPPESTAMDFQDVIGAEQKRAAMINDAEAKRRKRLSEVAGNWEHARDLAAAIRRAKSLAADPGAKAAELKSAEAELSRLFYGDPNTGQPGIGGEAGDVLVEGRTRRWQYENEAHGQAALFEQERKIKEAAPAAYNWRKYLEALAVSTDGVRKYLVGAGGAYESRSTRLRATSPRSASPDLRLLAAPARGGRPATE